MNLNKKNYCVSQWVSQFLWYFVCLDTILKINKLTNKDLPRLITMHKSWMMITINHAL